MRKRAFKYGLQYFWDRDFRRRIRNKETAHKNKERYGSAFPSNKRSLKAALFRRDGSICFWCGERLFFDSATIDHINPVKEGKNNKKENLRLIHDACRIERDRSIQKGVLKI
jgi:5-methylcytosine-specific restriction endonuclease McrA